LHLPASDDQLAGTDDQWLSIGAMTQEAAHILFAALVMFVQEKRF
jgi:hypothetical protein